MFTFKQFEIRQDRCAMKVGTDGVLLGAWARVEHCKRILDVGTGTGLVALMAAQRSHAEVVGIDLDADVRKGRFQRLAQGKTLCANASVKYIGLPVKIVDHRAVIEDGGGVDLQFGEEMLHAGLAAAGGHREQAAVVHEISDGRPVFR